MKYAFSSSGLAVLRKCAGPGTLFAFDFDGTLAPITRDPARAKIPRSTALLLTSLSRLAPAAVITGRPLADIRAKVPATFRAWAGDHGAETWPVFAQNS